MAIWRRKYSRENSQCKGPEVYQTQTYGGAPSLMEEAVVSEKERATFKIQWCEGVGQEFRIK